MKKATRKSPRVVVGVLSRGWTIDLAHLSENNRLDSCQQTHLLSQRDQKTAGSTGSFADDGITRAVTLADDENSRRRGEGALRKGGRVQKFPGIKHRICSCFIREHIVRQRPGS